MPLYRRLPKLRGIAGGLSLLCSIGQHPSELRLILLVAFRSPVTTVNVHLAFFQQLTERTLSFLSEPATEPWVHPVDNFTFAIFILGPGPYS